MLVFWNQIKTQEVEKNTEFNHTTQNVQTKFSVNPFLKQ